MSMDRNGGALFCDFCEKDGGEVGMLVSSPVGHPLTGNEAVHICPECVAVCVRILVEAKYLSGNDQKAPLIPK